MAEKRRWFARALVVVLLLASVLASAYLICVFRELRDAQARLAGLKGSPGATLQVVTLSGSKAEANAILKNWASRPMGIDRARAILAVDDRFVDAYVLWSLAVLSLACVWGYLLVGRPPSKVGAWLHWLGVSAVVVVLGVVDKIENAHLRRALDAAAQAMGEPFSGHSFVVTRLSAQAKFTLGAFVVLGLVLTIALAVRRWLRGAATEQGDGQAAAPRTFAKLFDDERAGFDKNATQNGLEIRPEAAGEPWVSRTRDELVGLALSGGGIRSATFNLGVLQGLHRLDLLRHVHYLATVSGGGYIGGFWSKWLEKHQTVDGKAPSEPFPDEVKESTKSSGGDSLVFEAAEVRHLREFGQFLVPRRGIFETETWGAVVAALAYVLPALAAAASVLGLSLVAWLVLTFYHACPDPWARTAFVVVLTGAVFVGMERWWRASPTGEEWGTAKVVLTSLAALVLVGALAYRGSGNWGVWTFGSDGWEIRGAWMTTASSYELWWRTVGIDVPGKRLVFSPRLYEPSLMWGAVALVLVLVRFRGAFRRPSIEGRTGLAASDRTVMRLVALAILWAVVATFWHIGLNLLALDLALPAAVGAGAAGGAFTLLRNWIGQTMTRARKATIWESLKPYVPLVLAYVTVGLAWALTASALITWCGTDWMRWYTAGSAMGVVALLVLLVDPAEFGMHAFYRDRICRAFLGAATRSAADGAAATAHEVAGRNRQTDLRTDDDVLLTSLLARPLHLICCAANNLNGDHLATLSRGARSAVLSRYGVAVGDDCVAQPNLWLGSALTASAAAFNSNMGSISMRVGPAVSFLMSALNLRLGLWVTRARLTDRRRAERLLPGALFYREMFGLTDVDGRDLHLSDGAHFDNLGLYELVRRHCRYVIASDCTADPEVAFDDFGSTVRRIREDFGVEIDIDLDPLKPGPDGRALQHAAVGTINYGWFDKGVLVYVKPTLVGNEPPDIRQYKMRNAAFPHEGTGDQFYDEAQWESYRRLGVHTIRRVFEYAERQNRERPEAVFALAAQVWHPAPPNLGERTLQMSSRFSQLEEELKATTSVPMLPEVFPELEHVAAGARAQANTEGVESSRGRTQEGHLADLGYLLRVMTLMEDVVFACSLDTHWNHPLNLGWVNAFARWATTPTFRRWWPLLRPMYGPGLRNFLEARFVVLRDIESGRVRFELHELAADDRAGLAYRWWHEREEGPPHPRNDQTRYEFCLFLSDPKNSKDTTPTKIQVGLATVTKTGDVASWTSDDFFVPLSLWGGGIGTHFVDKLIERLREGRFKTCKVTVKSPLEAGADVAQWEERRQFVDFYRRAGFRLDEVGPYPPDPDGNAKRRAAYLSRPLTPAAPAEGTVAPTTTT